ncbi:zinc finger, RING/FYVE/PHD-type containing protein [Tanacetum coccineum]
MDKGDKKSIGIKEEDMDLDLDFDSELEEESVEDEEEDWNEDFEQVEEMTSPWVSSWIDPATGTTVHGVEVALMKDDDDEDDVIRRDFFGPKDHMEAAPEVCSICFGIWTSDQNHQIWYVICTSNSRFAPQLHESAGGLPKTKLVSHSCSLARSTSAMEVSIPIAFVLPGREHECNESFKLGRPPALSCLPCGHIFGISCIKRWLQTGSSRKCPQCNTFCTLKDVRPLHATRLYNPAADQKTWTFAFKKFEFGRRNFALNKRSDALKRLADVMRWKKDAMKRRTESLHKMAYVLKLAKAVEQQADSMRRADALRLRANTFGRQADEYLRRDKAFEGRGKALLRRIKAFDQRSNAFSARFVFFNKAYEDFHGIASQKNTEQWAAPAT